MTRATRKTLIYAIEGINSFATVFYAYYIFFYMQEQFRFDNKRNLALAAGYGAVYTLAAWWGGRVAQHWGLLRGLRLGLVIMPITLICAANVTTALGQIGMMFIYVFGMCFTWPALEALVSEGETATTLPRHIGIYNLMWAGTGALSYFVGGSVLDRLGIKSIFYVPAALHLLELALAFALPKLNANINSATDAADMTAHTATVKTKSFLRMAWLANPFAYIAVNTLVAVAPGLALKFNLNSSQAGFVCSVWCFARVAAFALLWWWTGWHYRFRWLLAGYLALIISFVSMLAAPSLTVLVVAQLAFGCALGLIYYSSLFYSMDRTENHGEHGGIHEAAIGLGNFVGPAVGSASLYLGSGNSAGPVGGLLLLGLGGLLFLYRQGRE